MKYSFRKPVTLSAHRWCAYAAAGAATAVSGASTAEAEIHYSGVLNVKFNIEKTHQSKQVLETLSGGYALGFLQQKPFTSAGPSNFFLINYFTQAGVRGQKYHSLYFPAKLPAGALVSAGVFHGKYFPAFHLRTAQGLGNFVTEGIGFVGFEFGNNGIHYGWMRIKTDSLGDYILVDYAYGDPGDKIKTGQRRLNEPDSQRLPSEGSLGVFALGALGLTTWRKLRHTTVRGLALKRE
jgi:hypothetical protein